MSVADTDTWKDHDRIIIGIDIGTTCSAVSYSYVYTGGPKQVIRVGKWPGLPDQRGLSKIPSVVYYDSYQIPMKQGAEAMSNEAKELAEDEKWVLAQYFKLHLHPRELHANTLAIKSNDLPYGVSVEQAYADFLRYLLAHTRKFFEARTSEGVKVWRDLIDSADIILTHPNGWGLREQSVLRRAAIRADIASPADANDRIHFVSESEASVHFCLRHGDLLKRLKPGSNFLVCDAGGSTIDTTMYTVKSLKPWIVLEESKASGCIQFGGIFVNHEAEKYLAKTFGQANEPRHLVRDWTVSGIDDFETSLKPEFPRVSDRYSLVVDRPSYSNKDLGIKRGRFNLEHETVASFFDPSVEAIVKDVKDQMVDNPVEHVLLVGGYGESPYLRSKMRDAFETDSCCVTIVDDGTSKAVSDGAVIWRLSSSVRSRRARRSFGTTGLRFYVESDPTQRGRPPTRGADGTLRVNYYWSPIVAQNDLIEDTILSKTYVVYSSLSAGKLGTHTDTIYSYDGEVKGDTFVKNPDGDVKRTAISTKSLFFDTGELKPGFEAVCSISADLSKIAKKCGREGDNGVFYKSTFQISMTFGETELKAAVHWLEGGVMKQGPVTVRPLPLV